MVSSGGVFILVQGGDFAGDLTGNFTPYKVLFTKTTKPIFILSAIDVPAENIQAQVIDQV